MQSPHPPEREKIKKVSRACNTCRLKRKKCDGLEPCIFCTETAVECSYSREPRRRGPPSGYLRYTETRVALLETLLGLYVQKSAPESVQALAEAARTLTAESTTHTQDVWDAYKEVWTDSEASRVVNELAGVFAPFSPADNQAPTPKALLPSAGRLLPPLPPPPPRSPSPFATPTLSAYNNESFERHQPGLSPIHDSHQSLDLPQMDRADLPMPRCPPADSSVRASSRYPRAYWRAAAIASPPPSFETTPLSRSPTLAGLVLPPGTGAAQPLPDLPPPDVRATFLATYRAAVHPSLPILSPAQAADPAALAASPMLLLALCAYTARLEPSAASAYRSAADIWYESASGLLQRALRRAVIGPDAVQTLLLLALRDLGCGHDARAWRGVGAAIRVGVEYGLDRISSRNTTGSGFGNGAAADKGETSGDTDAAWTRGLWGVAKMLDLFLSIQLGREPGSAEALRPVSLGTGEVSMNGSGSRHAHASAFPSPPPYSASSSALPSPSLMSPTTTAPVSASSSSSAQDDAEADSEAALFAHTRALVRIVTRVHFYVRLGYGYADDASSSHFPAKTNGALRTELAAWHRSLPARFRVALGGGRVPRAVLEAHMLYQVGLGMLARSSPADVGGRYAHSDSCNDVDTEEADADEADADAASTFNVLLDKYRPSLPGAGPHVVWLVFAAARTGLQRAIASARSSGISSTGGNGKGGYALAGNARALQMQLYLLNCRDALAAMSGTWELAERCARTLEQLMEGDGGADDGARAGGAKRKRGVQEHGARKRWQEQCDFGGAWGAGAEPDDEGGTGAGWSGARTAVWDGASDERKAGRSELGGFDAGSGRGWSLGCSTGRLGSDRDGAAVVPG
ncbi:hypothetical protein GGX14DRAFT_431440 [Mycena pura]|uniref:Zn(2)-C6 fungal-type domain-containing protein n=1 Tax=Mycena pura TaxID=153505 RepID=A0AAD6VRG4_9AGAR|nr:hypothetical protein GGX14DRAFT_431440 [Mycena pura]